MTELRTWHEILIADLAANRAEAIDYLDLSLQEYQLDGDTIILFKRDPQHHRGTWWGYRNCKANGYRT